MIEQEKADQEIMSARREQARADAEWMKKVILLLFLCTHNVDLFLEINIRANPKSPP